MQIEQNGAINAKGIFGKAQVSGGYGTDMHSGEDQVRVASQGIVRGSAPQTQTVTYGRPEKDQGKAAVNGAVEEIMADAASKDAVQQKNEMVVGVHKMTAEHADEIENDGFSLPDTDIHTIVTETDKIQAQLAKAGKDTSYFTDTPSEAQLEAMAGSAALAAQYAQAFAQSQDLQPLDEGGIKYMLDNELEPTIGNLYYAQYNGGREQVEQPDETLDDEAITAQITQVVIAAGLTPAPENIQAGKWLAANDLAVTAGHMNTLVALQDLQLPPQEAQVVTAMAEAVSEGREPAQAYLVQDASWQSQAQQATEVIEQVTDEDLSYVIGHGQELTIDNLREAHRLNEAGAASNQTAADGAGSAGDMADASRKRLSLIEARRILEETRLVMTTEANYGLIKRGMEIDTRPLAQLVEDLRQQEQNYYKELLAADGSAVTDEQITTFQQTIEIAEQLRGMPAYALGSDLYHGTPESLHEAGAQLQSKLEAAGEAYETLMTAPRSDMGDSINKAFRNVDDILQEIGMESTAANARAVRILAYNQMEITPDSVTQMKLADRQVQEAFDSLKPAVVREMIRDGINPLQMDINELNEQAQMIRADIGGADDLTKFSEYLWKLEQNHSISQEERDSYIGIYRLIHQVEVGDGAAIGALVQQGAPLTMENLLRAVRSGKKSGMEYTVDDQFGGVAKKSNGTSISDQILSAYQTECFREVQKIAQEPEQFADLLAGQKWREMTPEQLLEYLQQSAPDTVSDDTAQAAGRREALQQMQEAAACSTQVYEMLETYDVPVTVNHVLAMQQMLSNPNDAVRRLFGLTDEMKQIDDTVIDRATKDDLMDEIAKAKEEILHKIGEHIQTPEELADAQQTLAEVAEHCGQTVLREGMTSLDVRQYQMMTAQLQLGAQLAREERYQIPILTSEGVMGVNVRIVRSSEKKGRVRVTMDSAAYGKVAAELQATDRGVKGYFASDSRAGADRLQQELPRMNELLAEGEPDVDNYEIHAIYSGHLDLVRFELAETPDEGAPDAQTIEIQTKELYGMAEKVVRFLQEGITKEA